MGDLTPADLMGMAGDGMADAMQTARALRSAAYQQAELRRQKEQDAKQGLLKQIDDEFKARQQGAFPVYTTREDPGTGNPTLMTPEGQNPATGGGDPTRLQKLPNGDTWYFPSEQERAAAKKPPLDDGNSFTVSKSLADAANKAGFSNIHEGSRLPSATGLTLLQHLNAAQPKDNAHQALTDQLDIYKAGGTPAAPLNYTPVPGAAPSDPHMRVSAGGQDFQLPTPDEQASRAQSKKTPKAYQFSYHTDDAGNVNVLRGDPESGDVDLVKTVKGAGAKRKDPDAVAAPKVTPAQLRAVAKTKGDGLAKAEADFQKEMQGAITPEDKQGAAANLLRAKQAVQDEYEESIRTLTGKDDIGHFDYAKQAQPAQASPAGGRGAPKSAAKAASMQAKPQGRIRVKLADGRVGTLDAGEFDPKTMTRLDGGK